MSEELFDAIETNDLDGVIQALNSGADVNARHGYFASPPLSLTTDPEIAKVLIDHGADVNAQSVIGWTPLHSSRNAEVVKVLIEHGADVHARNEYDCTPLHVVENAEIAKVLIDAGADVNAQEDHGYTPLHITTDAEVVQVLIDAGADVHARDWDGRSPIERHDMRGQEGMRDVILEALREREAKETKAHLEQAVGMREAKAEDGTQEEVQVIKQRRRM